MGLNDRCFVERQYASSERLETRRSVWQPDPSGRTPQDVAIEALRLWRDRPHPRPDVLLHYARIDRVERNIRPYLEALL